METFNISQIIQVLKDIKSLAEAHPTLKIAIKKNYSEISVGEELENLKFTFKENWILTHHNLPCRTSFLKLNAPTTLKRAVENCKIAIENLSEFYNVLDTIDQNANVLEPRNPSPKDNWRIIIFMKNLYIKIELPNPINTKDVIVTFHGKKGIVETFSDLYSNKQDEDEENIYWKIHYIKYDLEDQEMDDDERIDCGICFDFYNDKDQCPMIFCDNSLCPQAYHEDCLARHLKASSVKVLNVAVGECPYCKFKIQANFIKCDDESNINETFTE